MLQGLGISGGFVDRYWLIETCGTEPNSLRFCAQEARTSYKERTQAVPARDALLCPERAKQEAAVHCARRRTTKLSRAI